MSVFDMLSRVLISAEDGDWTDGKPSGFGEKYGGFSIIDELLE
jgi:hypothetical protein